MRKFSLLFCVLTLCLISYKNSNSSEETKSDEKNLPTADNSQNALDWNGNYKGILPCADCAGIETQITLNQDLTYIKTDKYLGKSDSIFSSQGQFKWNDAGSKISLNNDTTKQYQVGENKLFALDLKGQKITGDLEKLYILNKLSKDLQWLETYWRIAEIEGNPINSETLQNDAHLIFMVEDSLVAGSGGCNRLSGSFNLKGNNTIKISQMRSTMMACENMSVEQELNQTLQKVTQYKFENSSLEFLNSDNQVVLKFNK
ncbi:copper resistance protein NlpE N-terminal domain-containing protein [Mesohalobacter salilacus]|uniref:copper resistance protein NlpE N-terminal domain-containing protein n=1 Tax=Mesohalobacter salilacus TaxID=2491711 RepID=UPI0026D0D35A